MANSAASLGQAIGKLFEESIVERLRPVVEAANHTIGPERMKNSTDNVYQIDAVVRNTRNQPVLMLDPKYIRYTKHCRDKASWLCTAHYNLRKTYPTIRKTIAVLTGRWTHPSISLLQSFGIEVVLQDFSTMVAVLGDHGIEFDWAEGDLTTSANSLRAFQSLTDDRKEVLAHDLTESIMPNLTASVSELLNDAGEGVQSRVSDVEVIVKTNRQEMLLLRFDSIGETVSGLVDFMQERSDVSGLLSEGH